MQPFNVKTGAVFSNNWVKEKLKSKTSVTYAHIICIYVAQSLLIRKNKPIFWNSQSHLLLPTLAQETNYTLLVKVTKKWCVKYVMSQNIHIKFCAHMTVHRNKLHFNETNRRTLFQIYSCTKLYIFRGSSSAHHQEFSTVHLALAHVIQVWRQIACRIRMELQFHPYPAR